VQETEFPAGVLEGQSPSTSRSAQTEFPAEMLQGQRSSIFSASV